MANDMELAIKADQPATKQEEAAAKALKKSYPNLLHARISVDGHIPKAIACSSSV